MTSAQTCTPNSRNCWAFLPRSNGSSSRKRRTTTISIELGEYFSALSNEANLKGQPWAWLVFGVKDKPKQIVGSHYRPNRPHLEASRKRSPTRRAIG